MSNEDEIKNWVKPGTEVASVRLGQNKEVTYSKIDRVGKAWLFLEDGQKFHKLGLDRREGGVVGGTNYRLYKADDPVLHEHELDVGVKRVMSTATKAAKEFAENPTVEGATKVVEALILFTPYEITLSDNSQS